VDASFAHAFAPLDSCVFIDPTFPPAKLAGRVFQGPAVYEPQASQKRKSTILKKCSGAEPSFLSATLLVTAPHHLTNNAETHLVAVCAQPLPPQKTVVLQKRDGLSFRARQLEEVHHLRID